MVIQALKDDCINQLVVYMYNYNFCIKKLKESKRKLKKQVVEDNWLRNYHDKVQPNLLEHYDARVNAFIKRVSIL